MSTIVDLVVQRLSALSSRVPVDPAVRALAIETYIGSTLEAIRTRTPDNPVLNGFKVYSQVDEDGIIESISNRLPVSARNNTFVEIGCGRGVENNTHYLALKGYRGVWVDGSKINIDFINSELCLVQHNGKLKVERQYVTADNIQSLLRSYSHFLGVDDPEFFSLDIDGNDVFVLVEALKVIKPAVVCVEYNSKFPPSFSATIKRNDAHEWMHDDYHGASLKCFAESFPKYTLISCSVAGTNAFFIRSDLAERFAKYTIDELYRPACYELVKRTSGHRPTLKWLKDILHAKP